MRARTEKSIQMLKISKTFSELAGIIEGLEEAINYLDEQIIEKQQIIDDQALTENSWEWRDLIDSQARKEAILDIIEYLSKFK